MKLVEQVLQLVEVEKEKELDSVELILLGLKPVEEAHLTKDLQMTLPVSWTSRASSLSFVSLASEGE